MASITTKFTSYSTVSRVGAFGGAQNWFTPDNASVEDTNAATYTKASGATGSGYTNYLKCSNLVDSVPVGSTIDGLFLRIKRCRYTPSSGNLNVYDETILFDYLGSQSNNKADLSTDYPLDPNFQFKEYGSSSDKWGMSLTDSIINSDDFSLLVACTITTDISFSFAAPRIDYIELTVSYSTPAPTGSRVFLIT